MESDLRGDWVSIAAAASYLGLSIAAVRSLIRKGKIDARKLGYRTVRISTISIEKMMEQARQ